ncbi:MAG: hypothetical protein EXS36_11025 [Pedosphaera sp.]|nr:hypothetical protein [Pedosphaera sp.]
MSTNPPSAVRVNRNWAMILGRFVPERGARAVLLSACLVYVFLSLCFMIALPKSDDLWFYKHWARLVTLSGISAAYSGLPTEGYVDYPPFLLYPWKAIGHLYQWLVDSSYDKHDMYESNAYTFLVSMVAVLFHLAIGIALYWINRVRYSARPAAAAAVLYVLNPATIYNVAYLGLPDRAHPEVVGDF